MKKVLKHRFYLEWWVTFLSEIVVETRSKKKKNEKRSSSADLTVFRFVFATGLHDRFRQKSHPPF